MSLESMEKIYYLAAIRLGCSIGLIIWVFSPAIRALAYRFLGYSRARSVSLQCSTLVTRLW